MSRLLALDQASKTTGYAVFENGKLIKHGKFSYETSDIDYRLYQIREHIQNLCAEFQIDEIVYEDIQQQSNVANNIQTFKILAEVYGVISELFAEMRLPHSSMLAVQWKSVLGIKGKTRPEQKKNAQAYVLNTYDIKATQDESDAVCIGAAYLLQNTNNWAD